MRVFVAIELPEDLRLALAGLQSEFGAPAEAARWVAPELLHITLRFLGEISEQRRGSVQAAASAAAMSTGPFQLAPGQAGAFPHERNPRVLWVGMDGEPGLTSLQRLHDALEDRLGEQGFAREDKRFSPHVTIARVRERAGSEARRALGTALAHVRSRPHGESHTFVINALTVMQSDLRPGGPRYTPLSRISLGGSGPATVEQE